MYVFVRLGVAELDLQGFWIFRMLHSEQMIKIEVAYKHYLRPIYNLIYQYNLTENDIFVQYDQNVFAIG